MLTKTNMDLDDSRFVRSAQWRYLPHNIRSFPRRGNLVVAVSRTI